MCVDKEHDFGVDVVIAAAEGCECPGRWCETVSEFKAMPIERVRDHIRARRARLPFPNTNDVVRYQEGSA